MATLDLAAALRTVPGQHPVSVPEVLEGLGLESGARDVVVYLVDFGQVVLEPLGGDAANSDLRHEEEVASTMAGRAFLTQAPVVSARQDGFRAWIPIREGSDRTGVLAVTVPDAEPDTIQTCEDLAIVAGYLIATLARVSDVFNFHRRRKSMTLAASMQWDLLPPLVFTSTQATIAGFLEPAYEVGGDCFDYAINGPTLNIALMDSMGHGLDSAILADLAIGCYRHDRRHGRTLPLMHQTLDATIDGRYHGDGFVTGQLAQLDVESGHLHWTNAGHPLPLHLRSGNVIGELPCPPTLPWGLGGPEAEPSIATVALQPGDGVLFYTDGVVEGKRSSGGGFGLDRLTDLTAQTSSEEHLADEFVRQISQAVVRYHDGALDDDATLVLVQWHGPATS